MSDFIPLRKHWLIHCVALMIIWFIMGVAMVVECYADVHLAGRLRAVNGYCVVLLAACIFALDLFHHYLGNLLAEAEYGIADQPQPTQRRKYVPAIGFSRKVIRRIYIFDAFAALIAFIPAMVQPLLAIGGYPLSLDILGLLIWGLSIAGCLLHVHAGVSITEHYFALHRQYHLDS